MDQSKKLNLFRDGQELSLIDFLIFIKNNWRIIFLSIIIGLILSATYIFLAPKKYEAVAQIRMAQLYKFNQASPFGVPVEDPASLIYRMQLPTSYSPDVLAACGYKDLADLGQAISKDLKFTAPKGVPNTVELRVNASTSSAAYICAGAVVSRISTLQKEAFKPYEVEINERLEYDESRIAAVKKIISKIDHSGASQPASHILARDELNYFLAERQNAIDFMNSIKNAGTYLIAPIYQPDSPIPRKKSLIMVAGLIGGFFLGLLVSISCQIGIVLKMKFGKK